jgi:hypothetical protein
MSISVPKEQKILQGNADSPENLTHRIRPGFFSRILRKPTNFRNHFQRGQATLEILIVLLILIPLIFGGIELSRGVAVRSALDSGVSVMVPAISIDPNQWGWSATIVQETVDQNVFGSVGLDPTVHLEAVGFNNQPIGDLTTLPYGALFCVVGSVGYSPMVPLLPNLPPIIITVKHCGVIQKIDQP